MGFPATRDLLLVCSTVTLAVIGTLFLARKYIAAGTSSSSNAGRATDEVYDLSTPEAPRITGWRLALLLRLCKIPPLRRRIIESALKRNRLDQLRNDVSIEDLPVTSFPSEHPSMECRDGEQPDNAWNILLSSNLRPPPASPTSCAWSRWSVVDYHDAYTSGTLTPSQVADHIIRCLSEPTTKAMGIMISFNVDEIREQATASTIRFRKKQPLSLLDGVPTCVKDNIDMIGYATTLGTILPEKLTPKTEDATLIKRLKALGVVICGKANMHQVGKGVTGNNPHYGHCRNPYNTLHYAGGSSSGCAAAVSSGLFPFSIGADGGGSVRIPAAFCGVVGLKPTFGRISTSGVSMAPTVGHVGIIAGSVFDCAIGYVATAGRDDLDKFTGYQPMQLLRGLEPLESAVSGVRIGVFDAWLNHADPIVVKLCRSVVDELVGHGAILHPVAIPRLDSARIAHLIAIMTETNDSLQGYDGSLLSPDVQLNMLLTESTTRHDYLTAQRVRTRFMDDLGQLFRACDVIVTPTCACRPPIIRVGPHEAESDLSTLTRIMRFVAVFNLSGNPAISVNAGYDNTEGQGGMPVGVQLVGRHWEEGLLIRVANAIVKVCHVRRPQFVRHVV